MALSDTVYKVVLIAIQMKATEQYFPVVLHVYHPVQGGSPWTKTLTACLHGGGGPRVGEITCFGGVTRQSR